MKKIFLVFILLLLGLGAHSQIHFGVNTAVNSTFVLDKGLSEDPRYNSSMTYDIAPVGVSFGVNFGKKFGLQLESILSNQGQIYEVIDAAEKVVGERKIDLSYIHLPLFLKFMNGSDKAARANFSFGPQLSILKDGVETLQYSQSIMKVPAEFTSENSDGTYTIIDPSTHQVITEQATMTEEGTFEVPALPTRELMSSKAKNEFEKFKNAEFQIAASFGFDVDLGKHLFLSSLVRANYSLTDMRNGDVIDMIKEEGVGSIFEKRANLIVGVQLGLNYVIGGTRSYKNRVALK